MEPKIEPEIDQQQHWGRYQTAEDAQFAKAAGRERLGMKVAHKALNIPMDDDDPMKIDTRNTGLSTGAVLGVAGLAGLAPAIVAAIALLRGGGDSKPVEKAPIEVKQQPIDAALKSKEWRLKYWAEGYEVKTKVEPVEPK